MERYKFINKTMDVMKRKAMKNNIILSKALQTENWTSNPRWTCQSLWIPNPEYSSTQHEAF